MVCFKIIIPSSCAHGLTLKAAAFDRRIDNGAESQGEYYDLIIYLPVSQLHHWKCQKYHSQWDFSQQTTLAVEINCSFCFRLKNTMQLSSPLLDRFVEALCLVLRNYCHIIKRKTQHAQILILQYNGYIFQLIYGRRVWIESIEGWNHTEQGSVTFHYTLNVNNLL